MSEEVLCPICGAVQITKYDITSEDGSESHWFHCGCGCVFHNEGIDQSLFNDEYLRNWQDQKGIDIRQNYIIKTYFPLIEEMIYGRKLLDVGFTVPYNILNLRDRGWIATGIDLIKNDFITGDFEELEFDDKFDLIMWSHVMESFFDIKGAFSRAYKMLEKHGILFIATPAPELIRSVGLKRFGSWDAKHTHIMLSNDELKRLALANGFDIVLNRINLSQRFSTWNDRHLILQKKY